ncbi:helix-turn-helix transcriptional regulator [Consotaella aegiceratis]|uniref:helix-turn-helix transcriptional regulator n=1 Tax=Consotaella aegiceratis TaxID=3097961 RepID=UPI002F40F94A
MVDFNERRVRIYRCVEDAADFERTLYELRDLFGLKHVAYHSARAGAAPDHDPYVQVTYDAAWIKQYLQQGYIAVDPVVREGFQRSLPFDWSELRISGPEQMTFFQDALQHGVGRSGLSIPVTDKTARRGLFSICSDMGGEAWAAYKKANLADLIETANLLHKESGKHLHSDASVRLAARELECLRWIAQGKDVFDIALILGLSQHTVRSYLKSGRLKLGCATMAQAVFKATTLGLLGDQSHFRT